MKTKEFYITMKDKNVVNRRTLKEALESLPDGRFLFRIENKNKRTSNQNRYLHMMFTLIMQGFQDIGYREVSDPEYAKEVMKRQFLTTYIENGTGGKIEVVRRTRDLTKPEMAEFIDQCIQFAAENLNVAIPPPRTQMLLNF